MICRSPRKWRFIFLYCNAMSNILCTKNNHQSPKQNQDLKNPNPPIPPITRWFVGPPTNGNLFVCIDMPVRYSPHANQSPIAKRQSLITKQKPRLKNPPKTKSPNYPNHPMICGSKPPLQMEIYLFSLHCNAMSDTLCSKTNQQSPITNHQNKTKT